MKSVTKTIDPNALHGGLIYGGILGVFHIVFNLINNLMNLHQPAYGWLNRGLTASIFIFLALAGLSTFRAGAGAKAGLAAGLISALIGIASLWIITLLFIDIIAQNTYMIMDFQNSSSATMNQFIIEDALGATVIEFVVSLVLGATLGFVGGWVGSRISPQTAAPAM